MKDIINLAIIAGTGLYDMPGLSKVEKIDLNTPFGKPSAPIMVGTLEGNRIAFLARHGIGHHILPTEVNSLANIYALKILGVNRVIGINACGSLRDDFAPGHIVIPDQIFDNTRKRQNTFFGDGLVAHAGVAEPFCPQLSSFLEDAVKKTGASVHKGGNFIIIEGPRFSTKLESQTYRSWGMSIVGMTAAPEAFLAREAEMCYSTMAHVTDYDVWHTSKAPVTVDMVLQILNSNTQIAQEAILHLARSLPAENHCSCTHAMATAIITNPSVIPPERRKTLDLLIGRYL